MYKGLIQGIWALFASNLNKNKVNDYKNSIDDWDWS